MKPSFFRPGAIMASVTCLLGMPFSMAATIDSQTYNVDPSSTTIDTTLSNIVDWGYYLPGADFLDETQPADTNFDDITAVGGTMDPATNSKAVSGIGAVTITENDGAEYSSGTSLALWDFTFNDGLAPTSGTQTAFGAVNGVASSEDIFTITFNDLGVGTHTITLFMAHTATNRIFRSNLDVFAADGNVSGNLTSAQIGGSGSTLYFLYQAVVTTTDASADMDINIRSVSGSAGQFAFAGYTVSSVPEPSTAMLGLLGGLILLLRRNPSRS